MQSSNTLHKVLMALDSIAYRWCGDVVIRQNQECYLTLGDEITEMTSTVAHVITDSLSLEIMHEY